jgi:predicted ATPase
MYIKSLDISNIRSIESFRMNFDQPAGWHVLIGDNGAGKSTIMRSMALALVGPEQALGLRADWADWLNNRKDEGSIKLEIQNDTCDKKTGRSARLKNSTIPNYLIFKKENGFISFGSKKTTLDPYRFNWGHGYGWFSVAYGPYRRFAGGNQEWTKVFYSQPKLGAHLSAFGEDIALTESIDWLVKLNYQILEAKEDISVIDYLKSLVNSDDFLPHNAKLDRISSEGVIFVDGNGAEISVSQMSDGYRSILSLTFELIRQLVRIYGQNAVFKNIKKRQMFIDLPGIVLIDEIDAHLHPTWQTRIGNWFTKYFPKIQFIVTSHSPLVCRASENGTIWKLSAPGSEYRSKEIVGIDKEKLIFGNVLDAYGTEYFGKSPVRSEKSEEKLEKLGKLNMLAALGKISNEENEERLHLQQILSTDDPIGV